MIYLCKFMYWQHKLFFSQYLCTLTQVIIFMTIY